MKISKLVNPAHDEDAAYFLSNDVLSSMKNDYLAEVKEELLKQNQNADRNAKELIKDSNVSSKKSKKPPTSPVKTSNSDNDIMRKLDQVLSENAKVLSENDQIRGKLDQVLSENARVLSENAKIKRRLEALEHFRASFVLAEIWEKFCIQKLDIINQCAQHFNMIPSNIKTYGSANEKISGMLEHRDVDIQKQTTGWINGILKDFWSR